MKKFDKNTLTDEELCILAQRGDDEATELLLNRSAHYIWGLIKKLKLPSFRGKLQLFEWGEVGVLESIRNFDPARGNKFLTYAHYNILNELRDYLKAFRIVPMELNYPGKTNRNGDICAWALEMDWFRANPELRPMEVQYEKKLRDELLAQAMDALPEQERQYVDCRYGFAAKKAMFHVEIAGRMEISEAETYRIEKDTLAYFRECFHWGHVVPFFHVLPEAELQKELARESHELLFENFAGTHGDTLLAQYEEDWEDVG